MICYFEKGNTEKGIVRTYNTETQEYKDMCYFDMINLENDNKKKTRTYFMFKNYEPTDKALKQFSKDMMLIWNKQLANDKEFSFDYIEKFRNHARAVEGVFQMLTIKIMKELKFEPSDGIEFDWISKCPNGGLQFCQEGEFENCYGVDFKAYYASILNSETLKIPIKKGKEIIIDELPKSLEYAMYRVKITSSDSKFNKVFAYSKYDVYTHFSLLFAQQCQNDFNVNIELINDGEPNCYTYGKVKADGLISSKDIFGKWYKVLIKLKNKYADNALVKFLLSSIWGYVCKTYKIYMTFEEIVSSDYNIVPEYDFEADYFIRDTKTKRNGDITYELVNCKKPFKYEIARVKPFLLSRGRYITGKIALLHIEDVIRIQTDGLVFKNSHPDILTEYSSFPTLCEDKKTSGHIIWYHANKYHNLTTNEYHGRFEEEDD